MAGFYSLFRQDYGTLVGYTIALLSGIAAFACGLKVALKKYYGIEICQGAHQRSAEQHDARMRAEQEARDAEMAERLQREMEEEERRRIVGQKRKVRRRKMKELLGGVTMTVREEDIDRDCIDPETGLVEPTVRIPGSTTADAGNDKDNDDGPSSEERREPAHCAVCLAGYEPGDKVVWSLNPACKHIFHDDCILTWLSRGKKRCPCCRISFVGVPTPPATTEEGRDNDNEAASGEVLGGTAATTEAEGGSFSSSTPCSSPSRVAAAAVTTTTAATPVSSPARSETQRRDAFLDEETGADEADGPSDEEMAEEEEEDDEEETDVDYLMARRRNRTGTTPDRAAGLSPAPSPAHSRGGLPLDSSSHSRNFALDSSSAHSRQLLGSFHSRRDDSDSDAELGAVACMTRSSSSFEEKDEQFAVAAEGDADDEEAQSKEASEGK